MINEKNITYGDSIKASWNRQSQIILDGKEEVGCLDTYHGSIWKPVKEKWIFQIDDTTKEALSSNTDWEIGEDWDEDDKWLVFSSSLNQFIERYNETLKK